MRHINFMSVKDKVGLIVGKGDRGLHIRCGYNYGELVRLLTLFSIILTSSVGCYSFSYNHALIWG